MKCTLYVLQHGVQTKSHPFHNTWNDLHCMNDIVDIAKSRENVGLNGHCILRKNNKNSEVILQHTNDMLTIVLVVESKRCW